MSYLENNYKIVDDIVFIGTVLWTDFCLMGVGKQELYRFYAARIMNDFRYSYVNFKSLRFETEDNFNKLVDEGKIQKMSPMDTEKMFHRSLKYIEKICQQFTDKKVVVVTHHAPSEESIPTVYKQDKASAAFASNLEKFILRNSNIKLWCHGHIHTACDYNIGDCRVVCNPLGYARFNENTSFKDVVIDI